VEKVVEKGLPDGRKRFILYVLSAYLVNVKGLSEEEALQVMQGFIENSSEIQESQASKPKKNLGIKIQNYTLLPRKTISL